MAEAPRRPAGNVKDKKPSAAKKLARKAASKGQEPSDVFEAFADELEKARPDHLQRGFLIEPNSSISTMQSTLYIKLGNPWMLEHRPGGPTSPLVGQWMPAGEYRLTFTSHSKALEAVVIDPDPSGGLGTTRPGK